MQMPAANSEGWRHALAEACVKAGWDFGVQNKDEPAPQPHPDRSILVIARFNDIADFPITQFIVQHAPVEQVERAWGEDDGLSPHDALHRASLQFAIAHALIVSGASQVSVNDEVLTVPGLGDVRIPGTAPSARPDVNPLDLYQRLPVAVGTQARWDQSLFVYPDRDASVADAGDISLVGRRRLLFNGPNIHLPRGRWKFVADFSVDPGNEADLLIEWGTGSDVQALPVVISDAGRYTVELVHDWQTIASADFRISLMTPALAGRLEFHGGTISRAPDVQASTV